MNYRKIYYSIIHRAKKRKLPKNKYFEVHHVIPKSFFDSIKTANEKNNLVKLLPEEHWICHLLLAKFCIGIEKEKMEQALLVMSGSKKRKLKCTNKRYAKRKKSSAYRMKKKMMALSEEKKKQKRGGKQKFTNQKSFKSGNLKKKSKIITVAKKIKKVKKEVKK